MMLGEHKRDVGELAAVAGAVDRVHSGAAAVLISWTAPPLTPTSKAVSPMPARAAEARGRNQTTNASLSRA